MTDESKVIDRGPERRRQSPQQQLDAAAFEKAVAAEAGLIGHEKLCSERFKNLDSKVDDVRKDIKELNDSAREAIDHVSEKQESYHKSNAAVLDLLKSGLSDLTRRFDAGESRRNGMSGVWDMALRVAPIIISAMTFYYLVAVRHP